MNIIKALNERDERRLNALLAGKEQAIRSIYDEVLPSVISWVKENSGGEEDARDIFQDALIALYKRIQSSDFALTCTLKSYLRIICRNLWFSKLKKSSQLNVVTDDFSNEVELDNDMLLRIEKTDKEKLFNRHFDLLSEKCRKLLALYFDKVPVKVIAVKMETSESYVKKRKFICKEKLVEGIKNDSLYLELK